METLLKTDLIHDKDPRVQLAAILYLSQNTASAEAGQALYGLSEEEAIKRDPWLAKAVYVAASKHPDSFLASYNKNSADSANKPYDASLDKSQDNPFKDASIAEVLSKNYTSQKPDPEEKPLSQLLPQKMRP